jgi:DNA invertase Pin-like site-specific DNA recombinase
MSAKITDQHRQRMAYVYLRQSTMGQVRHHQESTERQYAFQDKAQSLGWLPAKIRVLDRDLGMSGTQTKKRTDFRTLVADVSLGQVGAVFALEASRLARSNTDWYRLIELCSLTGTLIVDEDGCYDPADFNDGLLLGLKATMSQAELHFIRARLQGGKLNKAQKGELRFPLPVGLDYDDLHHILLDADAEVRGAVQILFTTFRELGTAYAVVQRFAEQRLLFPKRAYGGAWAGKLVWGRLTEGRVRGVLKNPAYAGVYAFGRYRCIKEVLADGEIRARVKEMPRSSWLVCIQDHHPGYISFEEYLQNLDTLERNRTNTDDRLLGGPAREGLALLQGVLVCGVCGRRLTVRYTGNGGIYPVYECNWRKREGLSRKACMSVRCDLADHALGNRTLEILNTDQINLALETLQELEQRDEALSGQWRMRLERAEYEAQLAQRCYEQVDPANRLVAASLEKRWNDALLRWEEVRQQLAAFQRNQSRAVTAEQRAEILALAEDFPRLWQAPTTSARDKKRMLRLLIKDVTVEKLIETKQLVLHVRWQGGACEDLRVDLPLPIADRLRCSPELAEKVRELAAHLFDDEIAVELNRAGYRSAKSGEFKASGVRWIRHRHRIPSPPRHQPGELMVQQLADRFGVSCGVVYYWIETGVVCARRRNCGSPYAITLTDEKVAELEQWVRNSARIIKARASTSQKQTATGAL